MGAYDWSGMYLGANGGVNAPLHPGERLQAVSGFGSALFDLQPQTATRLGGTIGAQAGFNFQAGPWVWGLEADFNFLDGRRAPNGVYPTPPAYSGLPIFTISSNSGANYFGSLRARAGLAFDRSLIYLTAGIANGGGRGPASLSIGADAYAAGWSQSSRAKFAAGVGFEYAFAENWSARAEYLYLNQSLNNQIFDNGEGYDFLSRVRNENHILRFGMNFHFGDKSRIPGAITYGQPSKAQDKEDTKEEQYSVHAQSTTVLQGLPKFYATYDGPASFPSKGVADVLTQNDLFMGLRLWQGGSVYVNPEINEGYGPGNSTGSAAYPDGLAQKIGRAAPYMRFQRYFLRQIIGLDSSGDQVNDPDEGSRSEVLESLQNQVAGKVDRDRITLTIGKFSVGDVFDDNVYAHDPTTGFMSFAFNYMGAFDYVSDAWGYTNGASVEWKQSWWTLRAGTFQQSTVPNGNDIEPELFRQYMGVVEFEARYDIFGEPGALKLLAYGDNGRFAKFQDVINLALATGNLPPDVTTLQQRHFKPGGGFNLKQRITNGVGFFMRGSMTDGRYQTVDYIDNDRQISAGFVFDGELWDRKDDEIGVAAAAAGLHGDHIRYFELGGRGTYIGDGAMTYGGEKNLEAYYKLGLSRNFDLTADYQLFINPGHNAARGPVNVFALRVRGAF
ncbi:MAG: carbohydrate porin [Methylocystis sp.]|uniref:carbohydrate porin n=1 Tax=Methylocystis sp. TaxID=1911079 RepID=UPI003DA681D0